MISQKSLTSWVIFVAFPNPNRARSEALHSSKQEMVKQRVQSKDVEATFARLSAPKTARGCAGVGWGLGAGPGVDPPFMTVVQVSLRC